MAKTETESSKWFAGNIELADGTTFFAYSGTTDSPEEVTARIQAEYDASEPILELAEQTARELGSTAGKLLEMAVLKANRQEREAQEG